MVGLAGTCFPGRSNVNYANPFLLLVTILGLFVSGSQTWHAFKRNVCVDGVADLLKTNGFENVSDLKNISINKYVLFIVL